MSGRGPSGVQVLEEEGVYKELSVGEYNLEFVAVEEDVISLEVDSVYRVRTKRGCDGAVF